MRKNLLLLIVSLIMAGLVAEGVVRAKGRAPYAPLDLEISVEPAPFAQPHPRLGYMIYPGRFAVAFKSGLRWSATHGEDSLRVTGEPAPRVGRPELFVYGCSVAYGYGVEDSESFPFRLQAGLPTVRVRNFAVPGFAQTQALLQLERSFEEGERPETVVLTYASFHDVRNTLCRLRKKAIYPYNRKTPLERIAYPVARVGSGEGVEIGYEPFRYREWPLMRVSALVHTLESFANDREVERKRSREVTRRLILTIAERCRERGVRLIVAAIADDSETVAMLQTIGASGIETADLSFDSGDRSYTLAPYDSHPSARGHAHFADRLIEHLRRAG